MKWQFSVLLLLTLVLAGGCFLENDDDNFKVYGYIKDEDGDPIRYVYVSLGTRLAVTNSVGRYTFNEVAYGSYKIEAFIDTDVYAYSFRYTFEPTQYTLVVDKDKKVNFTGKPR